MDQYIHQFDAMGSPCDLQFYAESAWLAEDMAMEATLSVARIERKFSRYVSDNALAEVNHAAFLGKPIIVDDEMAMLLDFAFACFARSEGMFDITSGVLRRVWDFKSKAIPTQQAISELLPMIGMDKLRWTRPHLSFDRSGIEIDFGGIAKEYAADIIAGLFRKGKSSFGLVNLGGDLAVFGPQVDGKPWLVGIKDPSDAAQTIATVKIFIGALATSGSYENKVDLNGKRFGHLLNPRTGWPVQGLVSITALGPNCMAAGAAATIAMLKESKAVSWLQKSGIPFFSLDDTGMSSDCLPQFYQEPGS